MKNKLFQFKTNLNCEGCVSKVQSDLDKADGICNWHVDTLHTDKILTVQSTGITIDKIVDLIKSKGFKIEFVNQ